ncbi:chloramphenicol resistance protein [Xylariaceae sp. FL0255]|nr:chloramphenicol resistance protein [Xylariaceae sp. FL0255]
MSTQDSSEMHETKSIANAEFAQGSEPTEKYTYFSIGERRLITAIIGLSMVFSPLTANIYFPGVVQIQNDLNVSSELVDLTITVYLIIQGISPVLFGNAADTYGRRPVFTVMFAVYAVANLALALQNNYAALLVLRMVQSLGCSATIAISYGVIADVSMPAERGTMQGIAITAANVGPVIAPVIGGALVSHAGWHWVFWFLLIVGGVVLTLVLLFLPETARNIAGNGKTLPSRWARPFVSSIFGAQIPKAGQEPQTAYHRKKNPILNPLRSFRLLFYKDAFLVLLNSGVFYLTYYCVQASITSLFTDIYSFNESVIGACYLAIGFGVILGGYANGKLMNYNYKHKAAEIGYTIDKEKGDNINIFPIEQARTRSMVYLIIAHLVTLAAYGWLLQARVHVSGPLILQFLLGALETCIVQTFNTLLVDIFQDMPSTAAAAGNVVRCGLAAAGIAAMKPLMLRIGNGWYFTLLSIITFVVGSIGTSLLQKFGMEWRLQRSKEGTDESTSVKNG